MLAVTDLRSAGGDAGKHRLFVVAMVPPIGVGVEVGLQFVSADLMVHAVDAALHKRPEAFDGVRVNIAAHVDGGCVVDALVLEALLLKPVITGMFVRVDHRSGENAGFDVGEKASSGRIRHDSG